MNPIKIETELNLLKISYKFITSSLFIDFQEDEEKVNQYGSNLERYLLRLMELIQQTLEEKIKEKNKQNNDIQDQIDFYDDHFDIFAPLTYISLQDMYNRGLRHSQFCIPPDPINYVFIDSKCEEKLMKLYGTDNLNEFEKKYFTINKEILEKNNINFYQKTISPEDYELIDTDLFHFQESGANSITIYQNYYPNIYQILKKSWDLIQQTRKISKCQYPYFRIFWDIYIHSKDKKFRQQLEKLLKKSAAIQYVCHECQNYIIKYKYNSRNGKKILCLDCLLLKVKKNLLVDQEQKQNSNEQEKQKQKISIVTQLLEFKYNFKCQIKNCQRYQDCQMFINLKYVEENDKELIKQITSQLQLLQKKKIKKIKQIKQMKRGFNLKEQKEFIKEIKQVEEQMIIELKQSQDYFIFVNDYPLIFIFVNIIQINYILKIFKTDQKDEEALVHYDPYYRQQFSYVVVAQSTLAGWDIQTFEMIQSDDLDCHTDFDKKISEHDNIYELISLYQEGQLQKELKILTELMEKSQIAIQTDNLQIDESLKVSVNSLEALQREYEGAVKERQFLLKQCEQIKKQVEQICSSDQQEQKKSFLAMLAGLLEYLLKELESLQAKCDQIQKTTTKQQIVESKQRVVQQQKTCQSRQPQPEPKKPTYQEKTSQNPAQRPPYSSPQKQPKPQPEPAQPEVRERIQYKKDPPPRPVAKPSQPAQPPRPVQPATKPVQQPPKPVQPAPKPVQAPRPQPVEESSDSSSEEEVCVTPQKPQPQPQPAPQPVQKPKPEPQPKEQPKPKPAPQPPQKPKPDPKPKEQPKPEQIPDPKPRPPRQPQPQPAPKPQEPIEQPKRQPQPKPQPKPAPVQPQPIKQQIQPEPKQQEKPRVCVPGVEGILNSSSKQNKHLIEKKFAPLKQSKLGFGFWIRYFTFFPAKLATGLKDGQFFLTGYLQTALFAVSIKQSSFIFGQQAVGHKLDLEGNWVYIYVSLDQANSFGFVSSQGLTLSTKFKNDFNQDKEFIFFLGGSPAKEFQSFNGQFSRPVILFGPNSQIATEQQLKQYILQCNQYPNPDPIHEQDDLIKSQVDVTSEDLEQYSKTYNVNFPQQYSIQGWFKQKKNEGLLFRLSNFKKQSDKQPILGEHVLSVILNTNGDFDFGTYTYTNNFGEGKPYIKQSIKSVTEWQYIYFGYKVGLGAYGEVQSSKGKHKLEFNEVKHYPSSHFYLNFGLDNKLKPFQGFASNVIVIFGKGSFTQSVKLLNPEPKGEQSGGPADEVCLPKPVQKKCVEGKSSIINSQFNKGPVVSLQLSGDQLKDKSEYGYGFWFRYLTLYPLHYKFTRGSWSQVAKLTHSQTCTLQKESLLGLYQSQAGYFYSSIDIDSSQIQEVAQKYEDVEGVWSYTYVSYADSKVVAYIQFDGGKPLLLNLKAKHPQFEKLFFYIGGQDEKNKYNAFNGQFSNPVLRIGQGSFLSTINDVQEFSLKCNPKPKPIGQEKQTINFAKTIEEKFTNKNHKIVQKHIFPDEYGVSGWFKYAGDDKQDFQPLFRLYGTDDQKQYLLQSQYDPKSKLFIFHTQSYQSILDGDVKDFEQKLEGIANSWHHIYFVYSNTKKTALVLFEHKDGKSELTFKNIYHYKIPELKLLYGGWFDKLYQGKIFGLDVHINSYNPQYLPIPKPQDEIVIKKEPICLLTDEYEDATIENIDAVIEELNKKKQQLLAKQGFEQTKCYCFQASKKEEQGVQSVRAKK
ncbi:hypothetical protein pb186bvf_016289 [Paramecium bursaria]